MNVRPSVKVVADRMSAGALQDELEFGIGGRCVCGRAYMQHQCQQEHVPRANSSSKLLTTRPFLTLRQLSHSLKGLFPRASYAHGKTTTLTFYGIPNALRTQSK